MQNPTPNEKEEVPSERICDVNNHDVSEDGKYSLKGGDRKRQRNIKSDKSISKDFAELSDEFADTCPDDVRPKKRFKGVQKHVCNNELMHPRNRHRKGEDFKALSEKYPQLKPFVYTNPYGNISYYFKDVTGRCELASCLFKEHYDISWSFPLGCLHICPSIPSRVNYIHTVADLLAVDGLIPKGKSVKGCDIGVGASCIYPLLGASEYGWSFIGTDVDEESVSYAKKLTQDNKLESLIEIRHQKDKLKIFDGVCLPNEKFSFTMCNPPFHDSLDKAFVNPARDFVATSSEVVCEGGEYGFVTRMIEESRSLYSQSLWFTSLVCRLSTLKMLKTYLWSLNENSKSPQVNTVQQFTLYQGKQTRWVVAWSFMQKSQRVNILRYLLM